MKQKNRVARFLLRGVADILNAMVAFPGNMKARVFGVKLGKGTKVAWSVKVVSARASKITFGANCRVGHGVVLAPYRGGSIVFGENCTINPYCVVYGHGGLVVGNNVRIATHTVIIPANHVFEYSSGQVQSRGVTSVGIKIEDDVWIAAGARILDGVLISRGSIIAAGSVVVKSASIAGLYAGVPATLKREHPV